MTTPEDVRQYLGDKNINSVLKWITTELIIHEPEDPLQFIHNLTKLIISQNGYKYSIETIESLIERTRHKSDLEIEKESKILKDTNTSSEQDFSKIVSSMREIATELNPKKAAQVITDKVCHLLQCEKALLYSYDSEKEMLQINSEDTKLNDLKFSIEKGIIGRCIKNAQFEIINNVDEDKDYDDAIAKVLNIQTKSLLCYPLQEFETGEVYAVIEAINKENGALFTNHDGDLLNALGTMGQITMQNGIIYELAFTEKKRNESMLALWSHLNDDSKVFNINSLLFTITRRCLEIVDAEKCTFYFVDHQNQELWSMQGEVNIRMPIDKGLAGLCATSGEIVNEDNVYNNEKFDKQNDDKTGFVTRSMLCVPMKGSENRIIGVIQLINKKGMIEAFDSHDEQILQLVLSAASAIVERNQLFFAKNENQAKLSPSLDEKFVSDLSTQSQEKRSSLMPQDISALVEEEEPTSEERNNANESNI